MSDRDIKRPLLSICIPTYNRSHILKETLNSIISNSAFNDDVEIVISDNCSSDNTYEVCRYYTDRFPNVKYYKNEINIKDANFIKVLTLGSGEYLKLNNDWGSLREDSIEYMLSAIKQHLDDRSPLFFTSNLIYTKWNRKKGPIHCENLDDYVQVVSTYVTAINIFGIWTDQLKNIKHPLKYTDLLLNQVDWTYQLLSVRDCWIYNRPIFCVNLSMQNRIRGGYNWFEVHLDNYYKIMTPYYNNGLISQKTLEKDKKNLLRHFVPELGYSFFYRPRNWQFSSANTFKILKKYYSLNPFILKILFLVLKNNLKSYINDKIPISVKRIIKNSINQLEKHNEI